jgi:hypothetical protein
MSRSYKQDKLKRSQNTESVSEELIGKLVESCWAEVQGQFGNPQATASEDMTVGTTVCVCV